MRKRSQAREFALKALYQQDLRGELPDERVTALSEIDGCPADGLEFARSIIDGCARHGADIDRMIEETAENWRLDRMPFVDRNILRLATYEMVFAEETPPKVAINEAIELAKKYSTENSATYVNGVLDKIFNLYADKAGDAVQDADAIEADEEAPGNLSADVGVLLASLAPDPDARADMHVHSTASDGSLGPVELVRLAAESGLGALALSDHDSVEGVAEAALAAQDMALFLVPGVELSAYADTEGQDVDKAVFEVHVLGFFIDPDCPQLRDGLERMRRVRAERVEKIAAKLRELDVPVDADLLLRRSRGGSIGRSHVAREMVRLGHCSSVQDAFDRYLATGRPAYVPKERLSPAQAIDMIHAAGGCAVLAHPGLLPAGVEMVEELANVGLDGVEVSYPSHTPEQERALRDVAARLDLGVSGGSDFHGDSKPDIRIGQKTVSLVEVCDLAVRRRRSGDSSTVGRRG